MERPAARLLVSAAIAALAAAPAGAGEWHRLGTLVCSDCHTMHNSRGGQPMRYDDSPLPSDWLLRAAGADEVCLACHSGTPGVPTVMAPSDFEPPGGGFPADLSDPASHAHALGPDPILPPDGDTAVVMGCTTCHDPHGNSRYRNLRPSPSGTGRAAGVTISVAQAATANGVNADEVYLRANLTYRAGFAAWCMDCHNLVYGAHTPEVALSSSDSVDLAHWLNDPITNRVPVQNPSDLVVPSGDDQVFCLSCHKAHGSPHYRMQLWADGESGSGVATCVQCHTK